MFSEQIQLELARNAPAIIGATGMFLATLAGAITTSVLTIRNGRKTDRLSKQINGTLEALEKSRLIESDRLLNSSVATARLEEQAKGYATESPGDSSAAG